MIFGLEYHRPRFVEIEELTDTYGRFSAQPFERGYGITIGNSLRRVLLSSIEGAAITAVKIEGVYHEFSTIPGVREDVLDIILNLKQIPIKLKVPYAKTMRLKATGPKEVYSRDIEHDSDIEILDPNILIATLDEDGKLEMEMKVKNGRGYVSAEENYEEDMPIGYIPLDSAHSPVKKVNFLVEPARVGRKTDYEKLVLEIWTNGTVKPNEALLRATQILQDHLSIFFGVTETEEVVRKPEAEPETVKIENIEVLKKRIDEFNLSARAVNVLKSIGINYLYQLVMKTKEELLEAKNFGKKSLKEVETLLENYGLSMGMKLPASVLEYLKAEEKEEAENEAS